MRVFIAGATGVLRRSLVRQFVARGHTVLGLARLVAGRYSADFFTSSVRTSNARFRADFNWSPRFPSYREGLEQVVQSWKAEGFLN